MERNEMKEKQPSVKAWLEFVSQASLVPPRNKNAILETAQTAALRRVPLPVIIPVCTAVQTLDQPNEKGQTRELVPLETDNPRLTSFIKDLFTFHRQTQEHLGVPLEIMLLLADVVEPGDKSFAGNRQTIANESTRGIKEAFTKFDQENDGVFRKSGFKIPKVRKLSDTVS